MNKSRILYATIVIVMIFSMDCFGQKCTKFINYQNKTVNTKGLNMQVFGQPIGLGETNITTLQREASDQLQKFDLLQYNICEQLKSIKNDFVREKLQTQYTNLLMKMLNVIKLAENGQAVIQPNVKPTTEPAEKNPATTDEIVEIDPTPAPTPNRDEEPVVPPTPKPVYEDEDIEVEISFPCGDYSISTPGVIRAFGMESSVDAQIAKRVARTAALEELASKVEITIKTLAEDYVLRTQKNLTEEIEKRFENKTQTIVDKTLTGYTTACEKVMKNKSTQKYSYYIALEISEEKVLKPAYQELQQDPELKNVLPNYEKFAQTFNEVMNTYEKSF